MVSKEAKFFRQQLCTVIADILYQWMCEALGQDNTITQSRSRVRFMSGPDNRELGSSSRLSTPICDYNSILRDRRLKVIFLKALNSTRRRPILFVRFCWASFVMFVTASALACHRILVSLSETYIGRVPVAPKQFAFSAWYFIEPFGECLFWGRLKADIITRSTYLSRPVISECLFWRRLNADSIARSTSLTHLVIYDIKMIRATFGKEGWQVYMVRVTVQLVLRFNVRTNTLRVLAMGRNIHGEICR